MHKMKEPARPHLSVIVPYISKCDKLYSWAPTCWLIEAVTSVVSPGHCTVTNGGHTIRPNACPYLQYPAEEVIWGLSVQAHRRGNILGRNSEMKLKSLHPVHLIITNVFFVPLIWLSRRKLTFTWVQAHIWNIMKCNDLRYTECKLSFNWIPVFMIMCCFSIS